MAGFTSQATRAADFVTQRGHESFSSQATPASDPETEEWSIHLQAPRATLSNKANFFVLYRRHLKTLSRANYQAKPVERLAWRTGRNL